MSTRTQKDLDQMQTITLCEYNDGECHVELRYRGDGESFRYEMVQHPCDLVDQQSVLPLHPDFVPGYLYAAHLLTHIANDLYNGKLQQSPADSYSEEKQQVLDDLSNYWNWDPQQENDTDRRPETDH